MNKVFVFVLIAFAAVASAQNPPQPQCRVDKEAVVSLAQAYERILRGQYTSKGNFKKLLLYEETNGIDRFLIHMFLYLS